LCYGFLYGGGGVTMLSTRTSISKEGAYKCIESFKANYPKVQLLFQRIIESVKKTGAAKTIMSRYRRFPDINNPNEFVANKAQRKAISTVFQGSAADIVKNAMVQVQNYIANEELDCYLVSQIHDELIFEVIKDMAVSIGEYISHIMSFTFPKLLVPLKVKMSMGDNWGQLELYNN
jgi:DNA polymerase-1